MRYKIKEIFEIILQVETEKKDSMDAISEVEEILTNKIAINKK